MSEHQNYPIKIMVDRKTKHGTDFYYPVCELSKTLVKLKGNTKKVLTKSDMFLLSKQFDINLKEQKNIWKE
jgi:hypothetical protein